MYILKYLAILEVLEQGSGPPTLGVLARRPPPRLALHDVLPQLLTPRTLRVRAANNPAPCKVPEVFEVRRVREHVVIVSNEHAMHTGT